MQYHVILAGGDLVEFENKDEAFDFAFNEDESLAILENGENVVGFSYKEDNEIVQTAYEGLKHGIFWNNLKVSSITKRSLSYIYGIYKINGHYEIWEFGNKVWTYHMIEGRPKVYLNE